jgi:hypothetical protein
MSLIAFSLATSLAPFSARRETMSKNATQPIRPTADPWPTWPSWPTWPTWQPTNQVRQINPLAAWAKLAHIAATSPTLSPPKSDHMRQNSPPRHQQRRSAIPRTKPRRRPFRPSILSPIIALATSVTTRRQQPTFNELQSQSKEDMEIEEIGRWVWEKQSFIQFESTSPRSPRIP